MKKLIVLTIVLTIFLLGNYIGIGIMDSVCNGPYLQQALAVSYVKPFVAGNGLIYLGWGNKHWDYQVDKYTSKSRQCRVKGTDDVFGSDYKVGEKFDMECVWVEEERENISGCAFYYDHGYKGEGNFIDLTPWSKKIN
jgi:hypothetical protein